MLVSDCRAFPSRKTVLSKTGVMLNLCRLLRGGTVSSGVGGGGRVARKCKQGPPRDDGCGRSTDRFLLVSIVSSYPTGFRNKAYKKQTQLPQQVPNSKNT